MHRSGLKMLFGIALALAMPLSSGARGDKGTPPVSANAVMLDHNEFPCSNCLFGISDYYFCFDVDKKILIGHDKVRTQKWWQHNPNWLMERGKTVPIRYNDLYIWVPQPDPKGKAKELRLSQDYTKKIFLNSDACQAAVK